MTPLEQFIRDNKLKKADIARYLGIHPSNITQFCSGAKPIPSLQLAKLIDNNQGWDTSALLTEQVKPRSVETIDLLRSEVETLKQIVNNQSVIIASYEAIIKRYLKDGIQD